MKAAILMASLLAAATAGAQTTSSASTHPSFDSLDKNKDSRLSQTEASGIVTAFSRADTNGNGSLDRSEYDHFRMGQKSANPEDPTTNPSANPPSNDVGGTSSNKSTAPDR